MANRHPPLTATTSIIVFKKNKNSSAAAHHHYNIATMRNATPLDVPIRRRASCGAPSKTKMETHAGLPSALEGGRVIIIQAYAFFTPAAAPPPGSCDTSLSTWGLRSRILYQNSEGFNGARTLNLLMSNLKCSTLLNKIDLCGA